MEKKNANTKTQLWEVVELRRSAEMVIMGHITKSDGMFDYLRRLERMADPYIIKSLCNLWIREHKKKIGIKKRAA